MPAENDPNRTAALAALKRGEAREAIRCLTEALQSAPEDAELAGLLGVAYGMQGDLDAAVFWLRKATQLGPNSASAFYNLGGALERAGQSQEAISAYRRALVLEPQHPRARAALARMEAEQPTAAPIPSPFAEPVPTAFTAPAASTAASAPALLVPDASEPEAWSCRCGATNAAGYGFCPRCGAPAPQAVTSEHTVTDTLPAQAAETTPVAVPARKRPIALLLAGTAALVAVGFGIGKLIQGPPATSTGGTPAATARPAPGTSPQVAPPPAPPTSPSPEAPSTGQGLGLNRDQVMAFLQRDIEWDFQTSTDESGRPRVTGRSADGLTDAELVGAPEELEAVYLSFVMSPDEAWSPNLPNGRRVEELFQEYAPGASRWVTQSMEELLASGTDGERRERFADRYGHVRWIASSRRAQVGLTARGGGLTVTPAPEVNWLEEPGKIPLDRRYRFTPENGGDPIPGTLLKFRSDVYTIRLDSGETTELHAEDGYAVEPLEPTEREREWLRAAEEKRRGRRQEALRRNYVDGKPPEVGRRYRFRAIEGADVEGTLESLEDELFHIRPDDGGEAYSLRPENVNGVEPL